MHLIIKDQVDVYPSQKPDFHPTNGREGETATLFATFFIKLYVVAGGFAPRRPKPTGRHRAIISSRQRRLKFGHEVSRR